MTNSSTNSVSTPEHRTLAADIESFCATRKSRLGAIEERDLDAQLQRICRRPRQGRRAALRCCPTRRQTGCAGSLFDSEALAYSSALADLAFVMSGTGNLRH